MAFVDGRHEILNRIQNRFRRWLSSEIFQEVLTLINKGSNFVCLLVMLYAELPFILFYFLPIFTLLKLTALARPVNAVSKKQSPKSNKMVPDQNFDDENFIECINGLLQYHWPVFDKILSQSITQDIRKKLEKLSDGRHFDSTYEKMLGTYMEQLKVSVDVGDEPPRVDRILTSKRCGNSVALDIQITFRSSCQVFIYGYFRHLIRNVHIRNLVLRVELEFVPVFPIVSNFSIHFLDPFVLDWDFQSNSVFENMASSFDEDIKSWISIEAKKKLIWPNIPVHIDFKTLSSENFRRAVIDGKLNVEIAKNVDSLKALLPDLNSMLKVVAVKGEKLISKRTKKLGLCSPIQRFHSSGFAVSFALASWTFSSDFVRGNSPVWNYKAEFPIDYPFNRKLTISVHSKENPIGVNTQHLEEIYENNCFEQWYSLNTESFAKVFIKAKVIPLSLVVSRLSPSDKGFLCVALGTLVIEKKLDSDTDRTMQVSAAIELFAGKKWTKLAAVEAVKKVVKDVAPVPDDGENSGSNASAEDASEYRIKIIFVFDTCRILRLSGLRDEEGYLRISFQSSQFHKIGKLERPIRDLMTRPTTRIEHLNNVSHGTESIKLSYRVSIYSEVSDT